MPSAAIQLLRFKCVLCHLGLLELCGADSHNGDPELIGHADDFILIQDDGLFALDGQDFTAAFVHRPHGLRSDCWNVESHVLLRLRHFDDDEVGPPPDGQADGIISGTLDGADELTLVVDARALAARL